MTLSNESLLIAAMTVTWFRYERIDWLAPCPGLYDRIQDVYPVAPSRHHVTMTRVQIGQLNAIAKETKWTVYPAIQPIYLSRNDDGASYVLKFHHKCVCEYGDLVFLYFGAIRTHF